MKPQSKTTEAYVVSAAINANLGLVIGVYITTIFNSIQEILENYAFKDASMSEISLVASSPLIGGLFGALLTGPIGNRFGRWNSLILMNVISILGVVLTMLPNITALIIGRILTGFYGGFASTLCDIYITEITNEPLRGQLGSITNVSSGLGALFALGLGTLTPYFIRQGITGFGYRILLIVPGIFNLIQMLNLFLFFKFETPFYLLHTEKKDEAIEVLHLLYDEAHSQKLKEIALERNFIFENDEISISDLFSRKFRKPLLVSLVICVLPAFIGQSTTLAFSNMIFSEGVDSSSNEPIMLTNIIGVLSLVCSVVGIAFMKLFERRKLCLAGCGGYVLINLAISLLCYFDSIANSGAKILIIASIGMYSLTLGMMAFLVPAETLPDIGVGVVVSSNNIMSFISLQIFIHLKDWIGYKGIYMIFSLVSLVGLLISFFFMVETKNKSKFEILKLYAGESNIKERKE